MRLLFKILIALVVVIVLVIFGAWLGLQVKPARLPNVSAGDAPKTVPLSDDLPLPVRRFAQTVYGESVPLVESVIVQGHGDLAPFGLPVPSRFRFYFDTTRSSYYHDIEMTWYTLSVMHVHERLLDGRTMMDLGPIGYYENIPQNNEAATQGYWAEMMAWMPSVLLTSPDLRWESVDENTVRLYLPNLESPETAFTLRFDPATGLLSELETRRFKGESDETRSRWRNRILEWARIDGWYVPVRSETQWEDSTPWAMWEVDQVAANAEVAPRFAQFGGDVTP